MTPDSFGKVLKSITSLKIVFLIFVYVFSNSPDIVINGNKCANFDFMYVLNNLTLALLEIWFMLFLSIEFIEP